MLKGAGRIPNWEYFNCDIGKSHNKPSRNTFFFFSENEDKSRTSSTDLCNHRVAKLRLHLLWVSAINSDWAPLQTFVPIFPLKYGSTHHTSSTSRPLSSHTNTVNTHKQSHENKINCLCSNTLGTFIHLPPSFSETTSTAYDYTE